MSDVKETYKWKMLAWYMQVMKHTQDISGRFVHNSGTPSDLDLSKIDEYSLWQEVVSMYGVEVPVMFTANNPPASNEVVRRITPFERNPYDKLAYDPNEDFNMLRLGMLYPDTDLSMDAMATHIYAYINRPSWE